MFLSLSLSHPSSLSKVTEYVLGRGLKTKDLRNCGHSDPCRAVGVPCLIQPVCVVRVHTHGPTEGLGDTRHIPCMRLLCTPTLCLVPQSLDTDMQSMALCVLIRVCVWDEVSWGFVSGFPLLALSQECLDLGPEELGW